MSKPNFFIFGAAKSGTTSLQMYLKQHSEVFFPEHKEPNFYALQDYDLPRPGPVPAKVMQALIYGRSVTKRDDYEAIFKGAGDAKAVGEASVRYLYFDKVPQRIFDDSPDARLVAVLREPVARMYSHYCMNRQYQMEPLSLRDALESEKDRIKAGWGWDWHYSGLGQYAKQLKRYFEIFSKEQLKIFLYEDFVKDPTAVIKETCQHIGVDDSFKADMKSRGKVAYRGRNLALDRWLHWPNRSRHYFQKLAPNCVANAVISRLRRWNAAPVPKLSEAEKDDFSAYFADDHRELESLLDRQIPWRK